MVDIAASELFCLGMREPAFKLLATAVLCRSTFSDRQDAPEISTYLDLFRMANTAEDYAVCLTIFEKEHCDMWCRNDDQRVLLYMMCAYLCFELGCHDAAIEYVKRSLGRFPGLSFLCQGILSAIWQCYGGIRGFSVARSTLVKCTSYIEQELYGEHSASSKRWDEIARMWKPQKVAYQSGLMELQAEGHALEELDAMTTCLEEWLSLKLQRPPRSRYDQCQWPENRMFGYLVNMKMRCAGVQVIDFWSTDDVYIPSGTWFEVIMVLSSLLIRPLPFLPLEKPSATITKTPADDIHEALRAIKSMVALKNKRPGLLITAFFHRQVELLSKKTGWKLEEYEEQLVMENVVASYGLDALVEGLFS